MTRITISVSEAERKALCTLAVNEFRDPRAQAALIVRQELIRRGLISEESKDRSLRNLPALKKEPA